MISSQKLSSQNDQTCPKNAPDRGKPSNPNMKGHEGHTPSQRSKRDEHARREKNARREKHQTRETPNERKHREKHQARETPNRRNAPRFPPQISTPEIPKHPRPHRQIHLPCSQKAPEPPSSKSSFPPPCPQIPASNLQARDPKSPTPQISQIPKQC